MSPVDCRDQCKALRISLPEVLSNARDIFHQSCRVTEYVCVYALQDKTRFGRIAFHANEKRIVYVTTSETMRRIKLAAEREAELKEKEKAHTIAESLIALLDARGISVDQTAKGKIMETEKPKQLEQWLVRAATADSTEEMFNGD